MRSRRPLYEGVDWNCMMPWYLYRPEYVAFFTRAWIEIFYRLLFKSVKHSRPLYEGVDWNLCHSLKYTMCHSRPLYEGVDWNGRVVFCVCEVDKGRPLYEGVDWNSRNDICRYIRLGRPLYEGVDWNLIFWNTCLIVLCRPLYEGVDWNHSAGDGKRSATVALFTRAWIEIKSLLQHHR